MSKFINTNNLDKLSKALDNRTKELIEEEKARAIADAQELQTEINVTRDMFDGKSIKYVSQLEYDNLSESEKNDPTVTYFITDAEDISHEHENKEFLDDLNQEYLDTNYIKAVEFNVNDINIEANNYIITSPSGFKFKLCVNDNGELYTTKIN